MNLHAPVPAGAAPSRWHRGSPRTPTLPSPPGPSVRYFSNQQSAHHRLGCALPVPVFRCASVGACGAGRATGNAETANSRGPA
jgi:hypothetical protein